MCGYAGTYGWMHLGRCPDEALEKTSHPTYGGPCDVWTCQNKSPRLIIVSFTQVFQETVGGCQFGDCQLP